MLGMWHPGYCAPTRGPGDCDTGEQGSWTLSRLEAVGAEAAKASCLARCAACHNCAYVSVSAHWRDCSWFAQCDSDELFGDVPHFQSAKLHGSWVLRGSMGTPHASAHARVPMPLPPLRSPTPKALLREGWIKEPDQLIGRLATCATQACLPRCSKFTGFAGACGLCSCSLCSTCALSVQQWRTPSGRVLHAASTASEPQFTFAFSRDDSDMRDFQRTQLVEPALTLAWHNATRSCCASGGTVVDVGCNYGWYSLYALALGCEVVCFEPVPEWRDVTDRRHSNLGPIDLHIG